MRDFAISDTGRVRSNNQDRIFADEKLGLWIVADGMGGHVGGARASQLACEAVVEAVGHGMPLEDAFEVAHARVRSIQLEDSSLTGMGTTLVAVHECGKQYCIVSVGDSRAYRYRADDGTFECLTRDQNVPTMLLRRGQINEEQARLHPQSHVLTDCIGQQEGAPTIEVESFEWLPGDRLLLCSDGLSGEVDDTELARWFGSILSPRALAEKLMACALDNGGRDNVSLIVLDAPTA